MITQATKRILGKSTVWRGLINNGIKKDGVAGCGASAGLHGGPIIEAVLKQTLTPASLEPVSTLSPEHQRIVTGLLQKFGKRDVNQKARTAGEEETTEKDYLQYIHSLPYEELFSEEFWNFFADYVKGTWKGMEEYEPWRQMLARLFPPSFGYAITLETVSNNTEKDILTVDDCYLIVRQQTSSGRYVRLVACGFQMGEDRRTDSDIAKGIANCDSDKLLHRLEPIACGFFNSGQALVSVPWLGFCGTAFVWGHMYRGRSGSLGMEKVARMECYCGEQSLTWLAYFSDTMQLESRERVGRVEESVRSLAVKVQ